MNYSIILLTHLLLNFARCGDANGEAVVEVTSSVPVFDPQFKRLQQRDITVFWHTLIKTGDQVYTHELAWYARHRCNDQCDHPDGRHQYRRRNGFLATIMMALIKRVSKPVDEGVRPIVHLASAPELCGKSGGYYKSFTAMPDDPLCKDQDIAARLWKMSEEMTGLESIR